MKIFLKRGWALCGKCHGARRKKDMDFVKVNGIKDIRYYCKECVKKWRWYYVS